MSVRAHTSQSNQNLAPVSEESLEEIDSSELTNAANQNVEVPPHIRDGLISRDFVMHWDGSLDDMSRTPDLATWSVPEEAKSIFQSRTRWSPGCKKSTERAGDLAKVILVSMSVKKIDSSFPCQIALTLSGARGNTYAANGDQMCYAAMPNERNHQMNQIVLATSAFVNSEYLRLYPGMTSDKLRTEKIMKPPGASYTYVAQDHPVVEMIAENADTLQVDLSEAELIDGQWYKISNAVAERCLCELENELVDNLPITDLSAFRATIHRMNGLDWADPDEVCDNIEQVSLRNRLMSTRRRFTAVVNMTYAFM